MIIGVPLFILGPNMAITRVQAVNSVSETATAATNTITIAQPGLGNIVVVGLVHSGGTALAGYVSGAGYQWNTFRSAWNSGLIVTEIHWGRVTSASADTALVISTSQGSNIVVEGIAVEYSGFTSPVVETDDLGGGNGTSTSPASGTLTTAYPVELCVAILATKGTYATEQTGLFTAPTNSFSIVSQTSSHLNAISDRAIAYLERITAASISTTAGATIASAAWAAKAAAFRDIPVTVGV